jgi:hypothetical protein
MSTITLATTPGAGDSGDTPVSWSLDGSTAPTDSDMILLMLAGEPADSENYITYGYGSGETTGSVDVCLGYYMEPGESYEVRYVTPEYKTLATTGPLGSGSGSGAAPAPAASTEAAAPAAPVDGGISSISISGTPAVGSYDENSISWTLDPKITPSDSDMLLLMPVGEAADSANYLTYGSPSGELSGSLNMGLGYYMEAGKSYEVRYTTSEYQMLTATQPFMASGTAGADGDAAAAADWGDAAVGAGAGAIAGGGITDAELGKGAKKVFAKIVKFMKADQIPEATQAAEAIQMYSYSNPEFVTDNFDAICTMLIDVKDCEFGEVPLLQYDDPKVARTAIINTFASILLMPCMTDAGKYGAKALPMVMTYFKVPNVDMLKGSLNGMIAMIPMQNPELMVPHIGACFDAIKGGYNMLLMSMMNLYDVNDESRAAFESNIDVLITCSDDPMYGAGVANLFWTISKKNTLIFAPHIEMMVNKSNSIAGMMYFFALGEIAYESPATVYPHLEALSGSYMNLVEAADEGLKASLVWAFAKVLAGCGSLSQDHAAQMLATIAELLSEPSVLASDDILCFIVKEVSNLATNPQAMLGPYMGIIQQIATKGGTAGSAATDLVARHKGNDIGSLHTRMGAVEAKITEMNGKITETCQDMDAVKAYVDANIADVKDFIGEVVKKLPNPVKFSVGQDSWRKGGKKVLMLHFECSHGSGVEWTTETREWGKWMKMGFALVNTGKAALDLASNPLGLVTTGVAEFKGVYDAFKTKDDADFNTYIKSPFLTSAEQDKLVVQLREAKFFDKFMYDAQKASWFVPTAEEQKAIDAKKAAASEAGAGSLPTSSGGGSKASADGGGGAIPPVTLKGSSLLSKKNKETFAASTAPTTEPIELVPWARPEGSGAKALKAFMGKDDAAAALTKLTASMETAASSTDDLLSKAGILFALLGKASVASKPALSAQRKAAIDGLSTFLLLSAQDDQRALLDTYGRDLLNYAALITAECDPKLGGAGCTAVNAEAEAAVLIIMNSVARFDAGVLLNVNNKKWMAGEKVGWVLGCMEKVASADYSTSANGSMVSSGVVSGALLATLLDQMKISGGWLQPPGPPLEAGAALFKVVKNVPSLKAKREAVDLIWQWVVYQKPVDWAAHAPAIFATLDQGYDAARIVCKIVPSLMSTRVYTDEIGDGLATRAALLTKLAEDGEDEQWTERGYGIGLLLQRLAMERKTSVVVAQMPFISDELDYCNEYQQQRLLSILTTVASTRADLVYPMLLQLQDVAMVADSQGNTSRQYASIIGDCGALSLEHTKQVLPLLLCEARKLELPGSEAHSYLNEVSRLCHGRKELLDLPLEGDLLGELAPGQAGAEGSETTLLAVCQRWHGSSNGQAVAAAEQVIAHYEGRDAEAMAVRVKKLEEQCGEMNDKITKSCSDFDQVRAYMEENVATLKTFIADVAKKLPNPVKFSVVSGKMTKKIKLHFVCPKSGFELCTETSDWNKWVKAGFSLVQLGKAVVDIGLGNPLGLVTTGVKCFKGIYESFQEKDDEDFNTFISEPFLTSEEQDKLITGLKKAKFFDQFEYDAQLGAWCKIGAEVDRKAAAAAASAATASAAGGTPVTEDEVITVSAALAAPFFPLEEMAWKRRKAAAAASALPDSARVKPDKAGVGSAALEKWLGKKVDKIDEKALLTKLGLGEGAINEDIAGGTLRYLLAVLAHPNTSAATRSKVAAQWGIYFLQCTEQLRVLHTAPSAHFFSVVAHCMVVGAHDAAENMLMALPTVCAMEPDYLDTEALTAIIGWLATIQEHKPSSSALAQKESSVVAGFIDAWALTLLKRRSLIRIIIPVCFGFFGPQARGDVSSSPAMLNDLWSKVLSAVCENSPKMLVAHMDQIFQMLRPIEGETAEPAYRTEMGTALSTLYRYDRMTFALNADLIFSRLQKAPTGMAKGAKNHWSPIVWGISKIPTGAKNLLPLLNGLIEEAEMDKSIRGYMLGTIGQVAAAYPPQEEEQLGSTAGQDDSKARKLSASLSFANKGSAIKGRKSARASKIKAVDLPPIKPLLARILVLCESNSMYDYITAVSACALSDRSEKGAMLKLLNAVLQCKPPRDGQVNSYCLVQMVAIMPDKELLEPVIEDIRPIAEGGSTTIKVGGHGSEAAQKLVAIYEGRDLSSLVTRVDAADQKMHELNGSIKEMCSNMDEVEKYVQDNIADVKQFLGTVVKKLPQPEKLTVEGKVRKTLLLHFSCCRHNTGECLHPPDGAAFTTQTKAWNKWLKMGYGLMQAGKAVVEGVGGDVIETGQAVGEACKGIYDAFKEKDDEDFNKYISEPFLMSSDRDKLLGQLKESAFFGTFAYDAQRAGWTCQNCVAEGEVKTEDGMLMQKPRDDAPKDDPVVQAYEKAKAAPAPAAPAPAPPAPAPEEEVPAKKDIKAQLNSARKGMLVKMGLRKGKVERAAEAAERS